MDTNDLFPPSHSTGPGAPGSPSDSLTPDMIDSLRGTKPWVRFLSILGFILG